MLEKLRLKVKHLKKEIVPIYYSLFDTRTPIFAKILALVTVCYLLSPLDIIPDFIPVIGLLDDLIIVSLLITLTLRLIPDEIIEDIKLQIQIRPKLKKKWYFAIPIIIIYLTILIWLYINYFKSYSF